MTFEVKDKVVFLTGGAIGIGAKVVETFLEEGVKHVAFLDLAEKDGIAWQNELNEKFGANKTKFIKCDVTKDDELSAAYNSVIEENGNIDYVVNNAGIMNDSLATYKKEIEVNVIALVTSTLKAIELMRKDQGGKGGAIVNVASVAAFAISHVMPIYNATKSAVVNFSSCIGLPAYYSRTGVRVMTICFGATNTTLLSKEKFGSFDDVVEKQLDRVLSVIPIQKVESAAKAVVDTCKIGESGGTYLSNEDRPVQDITEYIKRAYEVMAEPVNKKWS